ncbi:MAG: XRE family transcriptional regulator [Desulfobacteraceae bacterium]|nr:MAG: XRE family transcriptional regulator [Desulfobacteraceae bacterium]
MRSFPNAIPTDRIQEVISMHDEFIWLADSFGEVIRRAREAKGLNQKELANLCKGISPMYISQIEANKRSPSQKVCFSLAHALQLDQRKLLLLAFRDRVPKEIRDIFSTKRPEPSGSRIPDKVQTLFQMLAKLPENKRRRVITIWEETLKLLS